MGEHFTGYWLTRLLFQRGIGCIYLIAFLVALNQFRPLLGEKGLLPVPLFVKQVRFWDSPSLFFLVPKDAAFTLGALFGIALSIATISGLSERFGTPVSMLVWGLLWILYLSFVNIGQRFYSFGWESILLETGFLAIFLGGAKTEPSAIPVWLLRWVLFRVMFGAGLIKIRADPCWKDLSCMFYHYETQPIPGPLSPFFHFLPQSWHQAEVLFNHFVELIVPFGYFLPQPFASIAGLLTILFQGILIASGNLSFLNWVTIVLAFSTFGDSVLARFLPFALPATVPRALWHEWTTIALAVLVAILSIKPIVNMLSPAQIMNTSFDPLHLVNTYGAFGSVTRERLEVIIEGTNDPLPDNYTAPLRPASVETSAGRQGYLPAVALRAEAGGGQPSQREGWKEYEFRGKPGDLRRRPPQIAPYHLRLDWLMWFLPFRVRSLEPLALSGVEGWFVHFLAKLLEGDAAVLQLLRNNPFPEHPPQFIRAQLYQYAFTTPQERRKTGTFWKRKLLGTYFPVVSLSDQEFQNVLRNQGWK